MNDITVKELYTSNKNLNDTINKNQINNNKKIDLILTRLDNIETKLSNLTNALNSLINIEEYELKDIKTNISNNLK